MGERVGTVKVGGDVTRTGTFVGDRVGENRLWVGELLGFLVVDGAEVDTVGFKVGNLVGVLVTEGAKVGNFRVGDLVGFFVVDGEVVGTPDELGVRVGTIGIFVEGCDVG